MSEEQPLGKGQFGKLFRTAVIVGFIIYLFWYVGWVPSLIGPLGVIKELAIIAVALLIIFSAIRNIVEKRKRSQQTSVIDFALQPSKYSFKPRGFTGFIFLVLWVFFIFYFITPIDIIPDLMFTAGWLDDMAIGLGLLVGTIKFLFKKN